MLAIMACKDSHGGRDNGTVSDAINAQTALGSSSIAVWRRDLKARRVALRNHEAVTTW